MAQRGRKSAAELSVIQADSPLGASRLTPLAGMSEVEKEVWLQVVNDHPADAFTETHSPLLELYSRHVVRGRILAQQIAEFKSEWLADDDGLKRYDKLLAMAEREGRAASSLATRLRITRQAIDQQTVARAQIKSKAMPWKK